MLASKRKKDESQALFTFSPFGLSCRRCENNVSIQIDARSSQIHLKKHGLDSRAFLVRTLVDGFMSQVLKAKASGSIEPYKSDSHLEKRWRIAVLAIFVATFQPIMLRLRPPNGWQLKGETNKRLNESFKSSLCVVLRAIRLIVVESPY